MKSVGEETISTELAPYKFNLRSFVNMTSVGSISALSPLLNTTFDDSNQLTVGC